MSDGTTPSGEPSLLARLVPWAAVAVLATAAALASHLPEVFVLDREAVLGGEFWRLWTGHLVHATTAHFLFDVGIGSLLLLLVPCRRALLLLPPFVGLVVLGVRPDLALYGGLSGVLHGLTVLAAVHLARRGDRLEQIAAMLLLVGVVAKALAEAVAGLSVFTSSFDMGGETVYTAHLAGVLGGLLLAALERLSSVAGEVPLAGGNGALARGPALRTLAPWEQAAGSSASR